MTEKTNILFVTTALLSAPHGGCMIRTLNIARQLSRYGHVTMLAVSHRFDPDSVELCKKEFGRFHQIALKPYEAMARPFGEIRRKWDMHWPFSRGRQADAAGKRLFAELARQHQVVWFHTLGAAFPFGGQKLPLSVMDLDDLNHCKYDQRRKQDTNFRYRCSSAVQSLKWKKHEYDALRQYHTVVVCSPEDERYLSAANVRIVPNGFAAPGLPPEWTRPDPLRIGFIGSLGYGPNYDGLVWFRDTIWPAILHRKPAMELRLIGSLPPPQYHVRVPQFTYLGYVPDPAEEMKSWSAMIVPILYGGGTRIKIVEAFSRMCPVVSTRAGAYGLRVTAGQDILLADEPELFARHCVELADCPEKGKLLAQAGWKLFSEHYTWNRIGDSIGRILDELKTTEERI